MPGRKIAFSAGNRIPTRFFTGHALQLPLRNSPVAFFWRQQTKHRNRLLPAIRINVPGKKVPLP